MPLRVRSMKPTDVDKCVALVEAHPAERLRYGSLLRQLSPAWLKLLPTGSINTTVVEDTDRSTPEPVAVGVSVFVTDEFLCELKALPHAWIGPTLTDRVHGSNSPILISEQIRRANSDSGLNLAIWNGVVDESQTDQTIDVKLFRGFFDTHAGYQIKEIIYQPLDIHQVHVCFQNGFFRFAGKDQYVAENFVLDDTLTNEPFLMGSDREMAKSAFGTWLSSLFAYNPPQLNLRPSEQRLLLAALEGLTDDELADEIGITLSAVKKTWRTIYERKGPIWNEKLPDIEEDGSSGKRGKEKKQHLLTYLRVHMEELRPVLPRAQHRAHEK